jgi:hypothetical protein
MGFKETHMTAQINLTAGAIPRFFQSYMLIPNTNTYYHGNRIIALPWTIAERSIEGRQLFIDALKSTNRNFQVLKGAAKDAWIQERIREGQKLIPPGHYTDKIFILIKVTGIICVFIMVSTCTQARL